MFFLKALIIIATNWAFKCLFGWIGYSLINLWDGVPEWLVITVVVVFVSDTHFKYSETRG